MPPSTAYDQSTDTRWDRNPLTKAGACHALAIYWILNTSKGADFFAWLNGGQSVEDQVLRVMQQQLKATQAGGQEVGENGLPGGLTYKLAWIRHKIEGNTSLEMVADYEDSVKGSKAVDEGVRVLPVMPAKGKATGTFYNYIYLSLKDVAGAHAIATKYTRTQNTTKDIKVFDSNYGEYSYPGVREYLLEYSKTVQDFYKPRSMYVVTFKA